MTASKYWSISNGKEAPTVRKKCQLPPATFVSEALKEVPASGALRACTSFDYFICNIPVVICKLDLVFCF